MMQRFDKLMGALGEAIMACLAALLLLQVLGRYTIATPLPWTSELARFVLVWITFWGAWLALRDEAHFRLEALAVRAGKVGRVIVLLATIAALATLAYGAFFLLKSQRHAFSPILGWRISTIYAVNIALWTLMLLERLLALWRLLRGRPHAARKSSIADGPAGGS